MENKELPSAKEYFDLYAKSILFESWTILVQKCHKNAIEVHSIEAGEQYAQLVAEYHVKQALESANNRMIDQAFNLRIHKQLIESLEMAILNA